MQTLGLAIAFSVVMGLSCWAGWSFCRDEETDGGRRRNADAAGRGRSDRLADDHIRMKNG